MPVIKGQIDTVKDDFWTERLTFFTAQLPTYYRKPQQVHGRFHTSEESYEVSLPGEIIHLTEKRGKRTYVMMHPYVLEPKLTLTIGLYSNPKHYADGVCSEYMYMPCMAYTCIPNIPLDPTWVKNHACYDKLRTYGAIAA
jgi:hypothetical protein